MKTMIFAFGVMVSLLISPNLFASVFVSNELIIKRSDDCSAISIEFERKDFLPDFTLSANEVLIAICEDEDAPENFTRFLESLNVGVEEIISLLDNNVSSSLIEKLQIEVQNEAYETLAREDQGAAGYSVPAIRPEDRDEGISISLGTEIYEVALDKVQCTDTVVGELDMTSSAQELQEQACYHLFDQFVNLYGIMQAELGRSNLEIVSQYLSNNAKEWEGFRKGIKPQTPWEMAINKFTFIKDDSKYFSPPPSIQYVFVHPSIAYDIIPVAADGDQNTEAFVIEGLGIHWWDVDRWYLPSGFSAVAVYADRATQSDWRPGLALYFEETLTLGVTRKDDAYGVFLSVDLVELTQDRDDLLNALGLSKIHDRLKGM